MRRWLVISLALLVMLPLLPGLERAAWANSELHPGGRLFFPLWDVSTPNRLTFIILTRENRRDDSSIAATPTGTLNNGVPTIVTRFTVSGTPGNCIPRGAGGSSKNVNRTDLGGSPTSPVFVDDVHFEYYGKSCASADETIHMSCADIDLFLLAADGNLQGQSPRFAFAAVAGEGRGALDVHLVNNGTSDPKFRKSAVLASINGRGDSLGAKKGLTQTGDDSLMGNAIISDLAEGWAAAYPAASAKTTSCGHCRRIDSGTAIGYENYPMEVFLPFALTDPFALVPSGAGAPLRNVLSLWGPAFLPGGNLNNTSINIDFKWWDGRERFFTGSRTSHVILAPLGGAPIAGLDTPLDSSRFNVANFVCGLAANTGQAENDGFPRSGSSAAACGAPSASGDADHPSDNFESTGDNNVFGHTIQTSTSIGWWRFVLRRDGLIPAGLIGSELTFGTGATFDHSGRGLVGVVLSSTTGASANGVGDATRLWHKATCEKASSATTWGPIHVSIANEEVGTETSIGHTTPIFNMLTFQRERDVCRPSSK